MLDTLQDDILHTKEVTESWMVSLLMQKELFVFSNLSSFRVAMVAYPVLNFGISQSFQKPQAVTKL